MHVKPCRLHDHGYGTEYRVAEFCLDAHILGVCLVAILAEDAADGFWNNVIRLELTSC